MAEKTEIKEEKKTIETMTATELEAGAYRLIVQINELQAALNVVQQELAKRKSAKQ